MPTSKPYRTERMATLVTTCLNEDRVRNRRFNFSDDKLQRLMFDKRDVDMYITYDQPIFRRQGKEIPGNKENQSHRTVFARKIIPIDQFKPKKKITDPRFREIFYENARKHKEQEKARGVTHVIETRSGRHISMEEGDVVYDLKNRQIWPKPTAPSAKAKLNLPKR